jgi:hypothetical protein
MSGSRYEFGFSGWDEPPFPRPLYKDSVATPFDEMFPREAENAPGSALFEIALVLVTPLAIAIGATMLLNAFGFVTAF